MAGERRRRDAERREAAIGTDAVAQQRAVVVGRKRLARQEVHDRGLHACERVGAAAGSVPAPDGIGGAAHELGQRQDLGAAQVVARAIRRIAVARIGQATHEGLDDVTDIDRCETRAGARQRHQATGQPQQAGKAVQQRVAGSEDHRGSEDRPAQRCATHVLLGHALGAQVVARPVVGVRAQRTHLQQLADAARSRCRDHRLGQCCMRRREPRARAAGLVEDADEIDHHVGTGELAPQHQRIVHVGRDAAHPRHDGQVARALGVPRQDLDVMAGRPSCAHPCVPTKPVPPRITICMASSGQRSRMTMVASPRRTLSTSEPACLGDLAQRVQRRDPHAVRADDDVARSQACRGRPAVRRDRPHLHAARGGRIGQGRALESGVRQLRGFARRGGVSRRCRRPALRSAHSACATGHRAATRSRPLADAQQADGVAQLGGRLAALPLSAVMTSPGWRPA